MTLIPIRASGGAVDAEDDTPQEWSLLELNGELIPPTAGDKDSGRMELGSVHFNTDGTPIMTLGSHELKGKVETLKQPFVVMKKRKREGKDVTSSKRVGTIDMDGKGDESMMDADACAQSSAPVAYEVAGIVKKKVLFDNYPKSIMR